MPRPVTRSSVCLMMVTAAGRPAGRNLNSACVWRRRRRRLSFRFCYLCVWFTYGSCFIFHCVLCSWTEHAHPGRSRVVQNAVRCRIVDEAHISGCLNEDARPGINLPSREGSSWTLIVSHHRPWNFHASVQRFQGADFGPCIVCACLYITKLHTIWPGLGRAAGGVNPHGVGHAWDMQQPATTGLGL